MKKILMAVMPLLALASLTVSAQPDKAYRMEMASSMSPGSYAMPQTTVEVKVVVVKETVHVGPYARFSQKYLGVIAPLSDKVSYSLARVSIDYTDPVKQQTATRPGDDRRPTPPRHGHDVSAREQGFPKVPVDKMSIAEKSLEDKAHAAAEMIFSLRKNRLELVTAQAGEHVFGAGLKSALQEIDRLEGEYLALFLGKTARQTTVRVFDVTPRSGQTNYVVCRFSAEQGIVPDSDLGATPLVLTVVPGEKPADVAPARGDKREMAYYRIPGTASCTVAFGAAELASRTVPVYQFGATVAVPAGK